MKSQILLLTFITTIIFSSKAQEEVNNYKYIIVPTSFEFLKEKDQYQVNSLTKFLFDKYGYTTFMANEELPSDLNENPCLGLTADVEDVKGGFLVTKLQINLKDCRDAIITSSKVGRSKEKEFQASYHDALREAFETFQNHQYKYEPSEVVASSYSKVNKLPQSVQKTDDQTAAEIERLRKEVEALKKKEADERTKVSAVEEEVVKEPVLKKEEVKEEVSTMKAPATEKRMDAPVEEWLYAQPIENGFQVVDTEPKKVMILLNSGKPDTYIVQGKNAIVYKDGDDWIYASNDAEGSSTKKINLKF